MNTQPADQQASAAASRGALVVLPAMGVRPSYYARFVEQLTHRGFVVTLADLEPADRFRSARADLTGYAELIEHRIPAAFAAARQSAPGQPLVVVGHSLGGQLGLISAGRFLPETPAVLIASGTAHHRAFVPPRRWVYLAASQVIALASRVIGFWPGDRLGFGGRQATETMRDWARNVRTGEYGSATATFDYSEALRRYRGNVHVIHVEHDRLAPVRATQMLLSRTSSTSTESTYAADRRTARPGSHFTWARDLPGVVPEIESWISRAAVQTATDEIEETHDEPSP